MRPSVGTYFETSPSMYQPPPAANPGWALAPVPGWGTNPDRAGPRMLATNGADIPVETVLPHWAPVRECTACNSVRGSLGDSESDANQGYIALAAAGGIFFGWFLSWAYHYHKSQKKKRA